MSKRLTLDLYNTVNKLQIYIIKRTSLVIEPCETTKYIFKKSLNVDTALIFLFSIGKVTTLMTYQNCKHITLS